jgi:hypothetical protein
VPVSPIAWNFTIRGPLSLQLVPSKFQSPPSFLLPPSPPAIYDLPYLHDPDTSQRPETHDSWEKAKDRGNRVRHPNNPNTELIMPGRLTNRRARGSARSSPSSPLAARLYWPPTTRVVRRAARPSIAGIQHMCRTSTCMPICNLPCLTLPAQIYNNIFLQVTRDGMDISDLIIIESHRQSRVPGGEARLRAVLGSGTGAA